MELKHELRVTLTNEDGEVWGIYQITTEAEIDTLLNELRPYEYEAPHMEPETVGSQQIVDDLCRALKILKKNMKEVSE